MFFKIAAKSDGFVEGGWQKRCPDFGEAIHGLQTEPLIRAAGICTLIHFD